MSDIVERMLAREEQERIAEVVDFNIAEGTLEAKLVPYEVEVPIGENVVEVITRGAFARSDIRRFHVKDQQHGRAVIGQALNLDDRDDGVYATLKISDTTLGRDVLTLLRDGALREMSIEFLPQPRYMKVDKADDGSVKVRHNRAELIGVSPVSLGAYGEHARVLQVRSEYQAAAAERAEEEARQRAEEELEAVRRRELAEIASYNSGPKSPTV